MRIPPFRAFMATIGLTTALLQPASAEYISQFVDNVNLTIPDNSPAGLEVPFNFSQNTGTVGQIVVSIDGDGPCNTTNNNSYNLGLKHTFISDITLQLISPAGTTVTLFSNLADGFGGSNLCRVMFADIATTPIGSANVDEAPFPGFWLPEESLSAFEGESVQGVWKLKFVDSARADVGIFQSATIYIQTSSFPRFTLPPQVEIDLPAPAVEEFAPRIGTFDGPIVTFSGNAQDLGNSLDRVEYVIRNSGNEFFNFIPATNVSDDWTEWTVQAELPVDEVSEFYVRAVNTNGDVGQVAQRIANTILVPDEPPLITVTTPPNETVVSLSPTTESFTFVGTAQAVSEQGLDAIEYRVGTSGAFSKIVELNGELSTNWSFERVREEPENEVTTFQFRSRDNLNTTSDVVTRSIVYSDTNQIPVLSILEPSTSESFTSLLNSRMFRGTSSDPDGSVSLVEYRIPSNETALDPVRWFPAQDVSALGDWSKWQFNAQFNSTPSNISVQVRAIDSSDEFSLIQTRSLNVGTTQPIIPVVNITDPLNNSSYSNDVTSVIVSGGVFRQNVSLKTIDPFSLQQIAELTVTNSAGVSISNISMLAPSYDSFSVQVPLEVGVNTISIKATNQLNYTSQVTANTVRTITRAALQQPVSPSISINFPALLEQTVANTQTSLLFAGVTTAGTFPIQSVVYATGPDADTLSPEQPVNMVNGSFAEWNISVPLQVYDNYFQVVAIDSEGTRSPVISRLITRLPITPTINILFPPNNFVAAPDTEVQQYVGTTSDPDGAIVSLQFRVTTQDRFYANFSKQATTFFQPVIDNSEAGDWSTWVFDAPLGPGINTIEIRTVGRNNQEINRISTTMQAPISVNDMYIFN